MFSLDLCYNQYSSDDWLQTSTSVRRLAVSMDTIAMATLNALTQLDHTVVDARLVTSTLIHIPAQVCCLCFYEGHS